MPTTCLILSALTIFALSSFVAADEQKWVSLFDGKTLDGWKKQGGYATYEAKDGMIVGTTAEAAGTRFFAKDLSAISSSNWTCSATRN